MKPVTTTSIPAHITVEKAVSSKALATMAATNSGQIVNVVLHTVPRTKKGAPQIEKVQKMRIKLGGVEAHEKRMTKKRGEPYKAGDLPWGTWMDGHEFYLLEHTKKDGEYNQYVRMYCDEVYDSQTQYFQDGKPVEKSEVKQWLYASSPNDSGTITPKISSIKYIAIQKQVFTKVTES